MVYSACVCVCLSFPEEQKPIQALLIGAARWHHVDAHYTEPTGCKWPVTNDRGGPAWQVWPHVLSRDVHDHASSQWRCPITAGWIEGQRKQSSITKPGAARLSLSSAITPPHYSSPATV